MTRNAAQRVRRIGGWVTAGTFLAATFLPLIGTAVDLDPVPPVAEMRTKAAAPLTGALTDLPAAVQRWYDDRHGFRDAFLRLNSLVRVLGLGSSTSDQVAIGRDGWLFLRSYAEQFHRAMDLYTPADLEAWRRELEWRREFCELRGAKYVLAFVPNKATVYPEHLPRSMRRVGERTRLDQLLAYLKEHAPHLQVFQVHDAILPYKDEALLYDKTDTHWNALGAFLAYRRIMQTVSEVLPGVRGYTLPELTFSNIPGRDGDLARMLGIETFRKEVWSGLHLKASRGVPRDPLDYPDWVMRSVRTNTAVASGTGRPEQPTVVVFRDSFAGAFETLLSHHFERAVLISEVDTKLEVPFIEWVVDHERPDLVLGITVERFLMGPAPRPRATTPAGWRPELELDPRLRAQLERRAFESASAQACEASARTRFAQVRGLMDVTVTPAADALHVAVTGARPQLLLPFVRSSDDEQVLLRIVATSPRDVRWRVYYLPAGTVHFAKEHFVDVTVRAGENDLVVALPAVALDGRLRLDPPATPGYELVLRTVEARLVRDVP